MLQLPKPVHLEPRLCVNYKLALAKRICQGLNNNKSICHLPLWRLNPVLLQLLTLNNP